MRGVWRCACGMFATVVLVVLFLLSSASAQEERALVLQSTLKGTVGISMEKHIMNTFEEARSRGARLIVFKLDTPGGLVSSMRSITSAILDAPVPVVVWVHPRGAQAASAGAFIVQSAHIAAMSSGTNVGAAHPVVASGKDVPDEDMKSKITNDLAAQIRSLAEVRGRNAETCSKMVTDSISLTSNEALEDGVIDVIADNLDALIAAVNGRVVRVGGEDLTILLEDYVMESFEMTTREKILQFVSNPSVAYLLLMVGVYAIIFEVLSPGGFVMGVAGVVMVLLGAYGLRMLPFNWAGLILLGAGIAVMVLDLLIGGIGVLSLFGMAALIVGALIVYRAPGGELLNVSLNVIIGATVAFSLFFLVAIWAIWKSMKRRAASGMEGLVNMAGVAIDLLDPEGQVKCHGEIWKGRSVTGESINSGEAIRTVGLDGLTLLVERESDEETISKEE